MEPSKKSPYVNPLPEANTSIRSLLNDIVNSDLNKSDFIKSENGTIQLIKNGGGKFNIKSNKFNEIIQDIVYQAHKQLSSIDPHLFNQAIEKLERHVEKLNARSGEYFPALTALTQEIAYSRWNKSHDSMGDIIRYLPVDSEERQKLQFKCLDTEEHLFLYQGPDKKEWLFIGEKFFEKGNDQIKKELEQIFNQEEGVSAVQIQGFQGLIDKKTLFEMLDQTEFPLKTLLNLKVKIKCPPDFKEQEVMLHPSLILKSNVIKNMLDFDEEGKASSISLTLNTLSMRAIRLINEDFNQLVISSENVDDLLRAADFFDMPEIYEKCVEFKKTELEEKIKIFTNPTKLVEKKELLEYILTANELAQTLGIGFLEKLIEEAYSKLSETIVTKFPQFEKFIEKSHNLSDFHEKLKEMRAEEEKNSTESFSFKGSYASSRQAKELTLHPSLISHSSFFRNSIDFQTNENSKAPSFPISFETMNLINQDIDAIKITPENFDELLKAADFFDIPELFEKCEDYQCEKFFEKVGQSKNKDYLDFAIETYQYAIEKNLIRLQKIAEENFAIPSARHVASSLKKLKKEKISLKILNLPDAREITLGHIGQIIKDHPNIETLRMNGNHSVLELKDLIFSFKKLTHLEILNNNVLRIGMGFSTDWLTLEKFKKLKTLKLENSYMYSTISGGLDRFLPYLTNLEHLAIQNIRYSQGEDIVTADFLEKLPHLKSLKLASVTLKSLDKAIDTLKATNCLETLEIENCEVGSCHLSDLLKISSLRKFRATQILSERKLISSSEIDQVEQQLSERL